MKTGDRYVVWRSRYVKTELEHLLGQVVTILPKPKPVYVDSMWGRLDVTFALNGKSEKFRQVMDKDGNIHSLNIKCMTRVGGPVIEASTWDDCVWRPTV